MATPTLIVPNRGGIGGSTSGCAPPPDIRMSNGDEPFQYAAVFISVFVMRKFDI